MPKYRSPVIYSLAHAILPFIYKIIFRYKIIGKENLPKEGRFIIASNHVNAIDPLFLGIACKRQIHFMAKVSLFKTKFMNWLLRYAGAFPVERGTGGTDALGEAYKLLEEERIVGVFIEGTRSKDGELLRPKTGISLLAFKTKSNVVPVSIIAHDGTCPKAFKNKTIINIGKPIQYKDLHIDEESSMHFRRTAKLIMGEIAALRQKSIDSPKMAN